MIRCSDLTVKLAAAIRAGSEDDSEYSETQLTHLASLLRPITRLLGR